MSVCIYVFNVSTKAKERVLKKENHHIFLDGKLVTIFLEPTKNPEKTTTPGISSLTLSQEGVRSGEKDPNEKHIPSAVDSCVQKVSVERKLQKVCICNFRSSYHAFHYWSQQPLAEDLLCSRRSFRHWDTHRGENDTSLLRVGRCIEQ